MNESKRNRLRAQPDVGTNSRASRIVRGHRLFMCVCLLYLSCTSLMLAQDNPVFNRVRQLPDLGACPSSGTPDPDLKKALSNALAEARKQAKNMVSLAQQAKDSGLLSAERIKEISELAGKMDQALSSADDCTAAREFAKLPAPGGSAAGGAPSGGAASTTSAADAICEHGGAPCINQPHEGDRTISGKLALSGGAKLAEGSTAALKVGEEQIPVDLKDSDVYKSDTGAFTVKVSALNTYNTIQLVQKDPTGKTLATASVKVDKAQGTRDKITVDQASLDFGHQAMQTASDSKQVVVTNKTGSPLTFQLLTSLGQPRDFKVSGCQNAVDNSDHCTFNVVFAPFPSNRLKVRESFVAVVPSNERDAYEQLRVDLAKKGTDAEEAENKWRLDMRCRDHKSECPDEASRKATKGDKEQTADAQWGEYLSKRAAEQKALTNLRAQFHLVDLNAVADHWKFPFTRAVVGVDLSAPSSRTLKQSYFIDFDLLAPFRFPGIKKNLDPLENRVFFWLNPRITSLPQATNFSTISSINETGSFFDTNQTIDKIAKGFDVNGGLDIALVKPRDGIPWWGEHANTQAKLAPSFIIGAGMSTPFSTDSTQVTSAVTQAICDAFAAPTGQPFSIGTPNSPKGGQGLFCTYNDPNASTNPQKTPLIQVQNSMSNPDPNKGVRSFIEFYEQDRSRFFRRYYVGLRLKTYFFSPDVHSYCQPFESRNLDEGDCAAPYDLFPGIIDLTFGQDESVTGGRTVGTVARLEAVYPLPWFKGMHVFGSMYTRIHGSSKVSQPFSGYTIVNPANGAASDLNTFRFALQPLDRDYFRVGVGVDLIQVFKKTGQPDKNAPAAPASAPKTPGA